MPRALFTQKVRRTLVPMRKATMDALFLTVFIFIGFFAFPHIILSSPWVFLLLKAIRTAVLVLPHIILSSPWVFLPIYALAYLLTVVLRLRQAARETTAAPSKELQASPIDYTAFTVAQEWNLDQFVAAWLHAKH